MTASSGVLTGDADDLGLTPRLLKQALEVGSQNMSFKQPDPALPTFKILQ